MSPGRLLERRLGHGDVRAAGEHLDVAPVEQAAPDLAEASAALLVAKRVGRIEIRVRERVVVALGRAEVATAGLSDQGVEEPHRRIPLGEHAGREVDAHVRCQRLVRIEVGDRSLELSVAVEAGHQGVAGGHGRSDAVVDEAGKALFFVLKPGLQAPVRPGDHGVGAPLVHHEALFGLVGRALDRRRGRQWPRLVRAGRIDAAPAR